MKCKYNKLALQARGVIQQTAKKNGVSYDEIYRDMQDAITHALNSTDPSALSFWHTVQQVTKGEMPTPEDVILFVSERINRRIEWPFSFSSYILH